MMTISDASTPVVVLGAHHHGALGIARSLGRLGVPVHMVECDAQAPALASRYCASSHVWNFDGNAQEDSIAFLGDLRRKIARPAILIPTTDSGALLVAAHAEELQGWYRFPRIPYELARSLCSKRDMHHLARRAGIPIPNAFFPNTEREAMEFAESARFPIMMKTVEAWHRPSRPRLMTKAIVHGNRELCEQFRRMADEDSPNLMLQEYILGDETTSWMFNGYFDERSNCLFGITGRKIRQNRPYAGVTSLGECVDNREVAALTATFMRAIGYRGILDIGYRFDERDGQYKVFDVNPRIGCTFRLFVADNGMDVARSLYCNLTGQAVERGSICEGRKWVVGNLDLASSVRYWQDGNLTAMEWLRSFRGVRECAYAASDDPRPFFSMGMGYVRAIARGLGRQSGPHPDVRPVELAQETKTESEMPPAVALDRHRPE